jgi:NAD(P)H-nitrite reductase large subunit
VDLGILVDAHLQTGALRVFAAGDAAEATDIARGTPWVNAIWPEAALQGCVAGQNMAGRPVAYPGSLSRNVMRIYNLDLMTLGLVNPPEEERYQVLSHMDSRRRRYRKLIFRNDRLVGALLVNAIDQGGVLMSLIRNQMPVTFPKALLMAPNFNFGYLLK